MAELSYQYIFGIDNREQVYGRLLELQEAVNDRLLETYKAGINKDDAFLALLTAETIENIAEDLNKSGFNLTYYSDDDFDAAGEDFQKNEQLWDHYPGSYLSDGNFEFRFNGFSFQVCCSSSNQKFESSFWSSTKNPFRRRKRQKTHLGTRMIDFPYSNISGSKNERYLQLLNLNKLINNYFRTVFEENKDKDFEFLCDLVLDATNEVIDSLNKQGFNLFCRGYNGSHLYWENERWTLNIDPSHPKDSKKLKTEFSFTFRGFTVSVFNAGLYV